MAIRLADFIRDHIDEILGEWEAFASTLVSTTDQTDSTMLVDHARAMLMTIAADLDEPQTRGEQKSKSVGLEGERPGRATPAVAHGAERLADGFSLDAAMAEYRALRASVVRRWQEANAEPIVPGSEIDDVIRFNEAIDQAICESVRSFSAEKDQQTRVFDAILSSSPDLSFTFDLDGLFQYANRALIDLIERPLDEIVGRDWAAFDLPDRLEFGRFIRAVVTSKVQVRGEMAYAPTARLGGVFEYILVPVLDTAGALERVAGTARDVTDRKFTENANWQKANFDALTDLPNRRLFHDRLEQDLELTKRTGVSLALLFIDLDRFKEANDAFGHHVGDGVLKLASERIRACVRATDTVARLGGDEFTVILKGAPTAKSASLVAEKIVRDLATSFAVSGQAVQISASVGIALTGPGAESADELMRNADLAMYEAKAAGSNQFRIFAFA